MNYNEKTVFLGIDVHKATYAVTAICEGQVVKKCTLEATPLKLISFCRKFFPGSKIKSAYEAGFCGFHLHRFLEAEGIENIVVHAAGIEIAAGDRVKTDKRDSLKIATHLSEGRLRGIHIPSPEREDYRAVTRVREAFIKNRSRASCQIKALLHQHGLLRADSQKKISGKFIKELQALKLPKGLSIALNHYMNQWLHLEEQIKEMNRQIKEQAKEDKDLEAMYNSVPGIGPTASRILANELDDFSRFDNERQLFSYIGLTPSEHSSGGHIRQGHITKQGKPLLRKILVQAAWVAIRFDHSLEEIYERLKLRVGGKRAIVGIARRLVGRIRACFRTGELYQITREIALKTAI